MPSTDELLQNLVLLKEDLLSNGGVINDFIAFQGSDKDGIGIIVTKPIDVGVTLITVPYNLCLSVDMISCDPVLSKILRDNPGLYSYPDEVLALGIMYASNPDNVTEWSHHINTFPKTLNSTLFWNENELVDLKGCNIYHLTTMMQRQMLIDWNNIHETFINEYSECNHFTYELYQWAISMVYSRAIGITRNQKYIRCIPPLIDMANHSLEAGYDTSDTFSYVESENIVKFISTLSRQPGEQCYASYGHYSNAKLAHTYGFILSDNPIRTIDLWTRLTSTSPFYTLKNKLLSSYNGTRNQTYDFIGTIRENYIDTRLLMTIRIIQCNEEEIIWYMNEYNTMLQQILSPPSNNNTDTTANTTNATITTDSTNTNNNNNDDSNQVQNNINNLDDYVYSTILPKLPKMISVRNELASYTSLKQLIISKMKVEQAENDRIELGKLLLDNTPLNNRKLMALMIRTEECTLYQETLSLIDSWINDCQQLQEAYIPFDDSRYTIITTTAATTTTTTDITS